MAADHQLSDSSFSHKLREKEALYEEILHMSFVDIAYHSTALEKFKRRPSIRSAHSGSGPGAWTVNGTWTDPNGAYIEHYSL